MTTQKQIERDEAIAFLRNDYGLTVGSVVYTTVLHVTRSGMGRTIKTVVMVDGKPFDVSRLVAKATGQTFDRDRGGVKVGGCGMDMTFSLVYNLSRALFPDGHDCTGDPDTCGSNDHSNDYGLSIRLAKERILGDAWATSLSDGEAEQVRNLAATIREQELGYRTDRHHTDGGYALTRSYL